MNAKTKSKPKKRPDVEPMGIVISGGPVRDAQPLIAAYVWGPAPTAKPRKKSESQAA